MVDDTYAFVLQKEYICNIYFMPLASLPYFASRHHASENGIPVPLGLRDTILFSFAFLFLEFVYVLKTQVDIFEGEVIASTLTAMLIMQRLFFTYI